MTHHRSEAGELVIERTPAELLEISSDYATDSTTEMRKVIESLQDEDDFDKTLSQFTIAENSLLSALRFLQDCKAKLR